MKITIEHVNELARLSLNQDCYEDTNYENTLSSIDRIVEDITNDTELKAMIKIAILSYCRPDCDYVIHKFKEYYAISQILDEFYPQEISNEIKVCDRNRTYPIQKIELTLDWKYNY